MTSETREGNVRLDKEQQLLVGKHLWLADVIAAELSWLAPVTLDGDVVQPARLGLSKAALHADRARWAAFVGYARKWILGEIFRAVDRHHAGFTASHRAALEAHGDAEELSGETLPKEHAHVDSGDPLEHAALAMGLCSASVRWARGGAGELARILDEELSPYSAGNRALFVGHLLDGEPWEELAREAGVSESTAKRRVAGMRKRIIARLHARGVNGSTGIA